MSVFELAALAESLRVAAGSYSSDSADLYELLEEVRQLISEQSGIPNPGSDVIYSLMKNLILCILYKFSIGLIHLPNILFRHILAKEKCQLLL